jgi:tetratricopeptide (TPR) repeat protein
LKRRREIGDKAEIVRSLNDIGFVEQIQGRYDEAIKYLLDGISLAREIDNAVYLGHMQANLSNIHEDQGNYGSALKALAEAETTARKAGAEDLLVNVLTYRGSVFARLYNLGSAEEVFEEALDLARDLEFQEVISEIQSQRSFFFRIKSNWEGAAETAREALATAETTGNHRLVHLARLRLAEASRSSQALEKIVSDLDTSGLVPFETQARLSLAGVLLESGNIEAASQAAAGAIETGTDLGERDLLFQAYDILGRSTLLKGDGSEALNPFSAALGLLEEIVANLEGESLERFLSRPDIRSFIQEAGQLFEISGRSEEAARLRDLSSS